MLVPSVLVCPRSVFHGGAVVRMTRTSCQLRLLTRVQEIDIYEYTANALDNQIFGSYRWGTACGDDQQVRSCAPRRAV